MNKMNRHRQRRRRRAFVSGVKSHNRHRQLARR